MGYVKYLKILLSAVLQQKCKDDQVNINKICKSMNLIDIDYNEDVFKNVRSNLDFKHEINKSNAVFLSQPGQITFTRKFRQVLEYGQFFLSYIMAFYFFLIIYLMRPPPQKYSILFISILFIIYFIKMDKSCI